MAQTATRGEGRRRRIDARGGGRRRQGTGRRRRPRASRDDYFGVEVEHGTAELVAVSARLGEAYSDGEVHGGHGGQSLT